MRKHRYHRFYSSGSDGAKTRRFTAVIVHARRGDDVKICTHATGTATRGSISYFKLMTMTWLLTHISRCVNAATAE